MAVFWGTYMVLDGSVHHDGMGDEGDFVEDDSSRSYGTRSDGPKGRFYKKRPRVNAIFIARLSSFNLLISGLLVQTRERARVPGDGTEGVVDAKTTRGPNGSPSSRPWPCGKLVVAVGVKAPSGE
jgi:hypothetical protein